MFERDTYDVNPDAWSADELEAYAQRTWATMSDEQRKAYDNDYDFYVSDLWFAMCT